MTGTLGKSDILIFHDIKGEGMGKNQVYGILEKQISMNSGGKSNGLKGEKNLGMMKIHSKQDIKDANPTN